MSKKKKKHRWLKWLLYFLLFVVVCIIILALSADQIIENKVKKELSAKFVNDSTSMYDIEYDTVMIRIWMGDFKLTNFRLTPKAGYIDSLKNDKLNVLMNITADQFVVNSLDIRKLLFDDIIKINEIELQRPVIEYMYNPELKVKKATKPLNEIFSDAFVSAGINNLLIKSASILVHNVKTIDTIELRIDSATLHVEKILLDTNTIRQVIPLSYGQIALDVRAVHLGFLPMYTVDFDKFKVSIKDSSLDISNFRLTPKYDNEKFNEIVGAQCDVFTISFEKLSVRGYDLYKIANENRIDIHIVELTAPNLSDYRDRRIPRPPYKYKPLFSEIVRNIPIPIHIKEVIATDGRVAYLEVAPKGTQPGEVVLTDADLSITNITNDPAILDDNPNMVVDIEARLMDSAAFQVNLKFPILDKNKNFKTEGTINQIQGTAMNPFLIYAGGVEIKSGNIHGLTFSFDSNDDISEGSLDIEYEDLKLDILSTKKEDKSNKFFSFAANTVVRSSNLKDSKKYKQGEVYYERNTDKSFFNFFVKSLLTGLQSTAAPITVESEKKREKKEEKETKKESRKEKRAEKKAEK